MTFKEKLEEILSNFARVTLITALDEEYDDDKALKAHADKILALIESDIVGEDLSVSNEHDPIVSIKNIINQYKEAQREKLR